MTDAVHQTVLDQLFNNARTHNKWQDKPVDDATLVKIYDLVKMGPTTQNTQPGRFIFVKSQAAKEKLKPCLGAANQDKMMKSGATVIVSYDLRFYENLVKTFPHSPNAHERYQADPVAAEAAAYRNGSMQGGYLIMAVRALGLDCGAMSGFNNKMVDELFFPDGRFKSNFLLNLGYGDASGMFERQPRLSFEEAAKIL